MLGVEGKEQLGGNATEDNIIINFKKMTPKN